MSENLATGRRLHYKTIDDVKPEVWHDVNFMANTDPNYPNFCLPTNIHSIMRFFTSRYEPDKYYISKLCSYSPDTGARKAKSLLELADQGYEVIWYEDFGLDDLRLMTDDLYVQHLERSFPNQQFHSSSAARRGISAEVKRIHQYAKKGLAFENRKGTVKDIRNMLMAGFLVRLSVDARRLFPDDALQAEPYSAHSILGVGFGKDIENDQEGLIFHNSLTSISIPNQFLPWHRLMEAVDGFSTARPLNGYRHHPHSAPQSLIATEICKRLLGPPHSGPGVFPRPAQTDPDVAGVFQVTTNFLRRGMSDIFEDYTLPEQELDLDKLILHALAHTLSHESGLVAKWYEIDRGGNKQALLQSSLFRQCQKEELKLIWKAGSAALIKKCIVEQRPVIVPVDANKLSPRTEQKAKADPQVIALVGIGKGPDPVTNHFKEGFIFYSSKSPLPYQFLPYARIAVAREAIDNRRRAIVLDRNAEFEMARDIIWLARRMAEAETNRKNDL